MQKKIRIPIMVILSLVMLLGVVGAAAAQAPETDRPLHSRRWFRGEIITLEEDAFTLTTSAGHELYVVTDADTRFRHPDLDGPTLADFNAGDMVAVVGQVTDAGVRARLVAFVPADRANDRAAVGEITAIHGETIEFTTRNGRAVTLITTDETRFRVGQNRNASLADFAAGDRVAVVGRPTDTENNFVALWVAKRDA